MTISVAWGRSANVPRKLSVEYFGAIYHVMNRGDRREPIFKDDLDRRRFLETLGAVRERRAGKSHYGEELRESAEAKAQRIVAEELKRRGLAEDDLSKRRKGDPERERIARRLRQETIVTLGWIAERLRMGSVSMVVHCIRGAN